jgi:parallel beta-helix repeat protein
MPPRLFVSLLACAFTTLPAAARTIAVSDVTGLKAAIAEAAPGDDIVLANGTYPVPRKILVTSSGTAQAPITLRAAHPYRAAILSSSLIAFELTGSYWHFVDLDIRGTCTLDTMCEHAFHVTGNVTGFQLTGSRLADFNAHIKVNSNPAHELPSNGLIENNEFFDTHPRRTNNPVATINIDNAIGWVVRNNVIHDFQKDGTGEDSYGAFVKGGSERPLIERNLITCARDRPMLGRMVGLSFGAHGMDPALCPPHWDANTPCDPEVSGGVIRNNIVLNCNGEGIYLNKASGSEILSNTLAQTGGITFRYPGSNGAARFNMLNAEIRATDGARVTASCNVAVGGLSDGPGQGASAGPPCPSVAVSRTAVAPVNSGR